jgi:hypothetical protein
LFGLVRRKALGKAEVFQERNPDSSHRRLGRMLEWGATFNSRQKQNRTHAKTGNDAEGVFPIFD